MEQALNDLSIFRDSLLLMLEPGEHCETDKGYQGSTPTHIKRPGVLWADPNTTEKRHGFGAIAVVVGITVYIIAVVIAGLI